MSTILNEIAKKVLPKIAQKTAKSTKTQPHGSASQNQSFGRKLFQPSLEDEFKVLSQKELQDLLGTEPPALVAPRLRRLAIPQEEIEVDYYARLKNAIENRDPYADRKKTSRTVPSTSEPRQRDRTDEPVVPAIPPFPDIPELTPDIPSTPSIPEGGVDEGIPTYPDMPPGSTPFNDGVWPAPFIPPEQPERKRETDVYDCEEAKKIARMFGLPEPLCGGGSGQTTRITAFGS